MRHAPGRRRAPVRADRALRCRILLRAFQPTMPTTIRRNVMPVVSALRRAAAGVPFFTAMVVTALLASPVSANEALKWNDTAAKAAGLGGQNPIQLTRTVAMVQGAVHDALNAIKPRY